MREIKFRAWDTQYKKMYPEIAVDGDGCVVYMYDDGYENYPSQIVMQYTGLKDKNGKEVFEGDVVRFKLFDTATPTIWVVDIPKFYIAMISTKEEQIEIIGNIYENPELLDK